MNDCYTLHQGSSPLLVSVPHDGRNIPAAIRRRMTAEGRAISDTDWHVAKLYKFVVDSDASLLVADYSRYVVDLNRSAEDETLYPGMVATGLCPVRTFAGDVIYLCDEPVSAEEKTQRVQDYWKPYHNCIQAELARLRELHGYAVLWDAHSIPGVVPRLFEGELPELNIGTFDGKSCGRQKQDAVAAIAAESSWSSVLNGRFKGGFITRNYGAPDDGVHAIQLEIAQRTYMDETSLRYDGSNACRLQETLRKMLSACTIP